MTSFLQGAKTTLAPTLLGFSGFWPCLAAMMIAVVDSVPAASREFRKPLISVSVAFMAACMACHRTSNRIV